MKKVLIISYYWPPAGGPGSQRMVKFVKYLPQFGWQPVVLTVKKGEYAYLDPSLKSDVPKSIRVYRTPQIDPFRFYKLFTGKKSGSTIPTAILTQKKTKPAEKLASFIRANFFIPDARIGWVPFAFYFSHKLIVNENIDTVFISSPPHSSQLTGLLLKKVKPIKWVADLRDPWTDIRYYEFVHRNKMVNSIDRFMERKILNSANVITTVSQDLVRMFSSKLKTNNLSKFQVIPNGYDDEDFKNLLYKPDSTFKIVHTGNMQEHQNPLVLWKSLKKIVSEKPEFMNFIRVKLIGYVHPQILDNIREYGLENLVEIQSFRPHREILPLIKSAELLLLVVPQVKNNKGIVTGKLFEYLGANRPVLLIGPKNCDAAEIVKPLEGCGIFDYEEELQLRSFLLKMIKRWEKRKIYYDNYGKSKKFSRAELTKNLADIFKRIDKPK